MDGSIAYTVDLVLISHGDLAHAGLIPYAYSHWNLRAPSYCTLPVQAMARMAVLDQIESLRSEEDVDVAEGPQIEIDGQEQRDIEIQEQNKSNKYIANVKQVHEAFDSFTALRYSQPTHLQGETLLFSW